LQNGERDVEGLQVLDERSAVLPEVHRLRELGRLRRRKLDFVLPRQVDDGRKPEAAVEVDVEVRLRQLLEERERERRRTVA
jgi:hypothetical protein